MFSTFDVARHPGSKGVTYIVSVVFNNCFRRRSKRAAQRRAREQETLFVRSSYMGAVQCLVKPPANAAEKVGGDDGEFCNHVKQATSPNPLRYDGKLGGRFLASPLS